MDREIQVLIIREFLNQAIKEDYEPDAIGRMIFNLIDVLDDLRE